MAVYQLHSERFSYKRVEAVKNTACINRTRACHYLAAATLLLLERNHPLLLLQLKHWLLLLLLLLPPQFMGFQAQAGPASLNIATLGGGRSNLLLRATLYAPDGSIVWSASGSGAQMPTRNLPATGTYYLAIASVGVGTFASNGFSNYGSRGQWEANATYVPCAVNCGTPPPTMLEVMPSPSPSPVPVPVTLQYAKVTSMGLSPVKTSDPATWLCTGELS
jgi:hypothetical protein